MGRKAQKAKKKLTEETSSDEEETTPQEHSSSDSDDSSSEEEVQQQQQSKKNNSKGGKNNQKPGGKKSKAQEQQDTKATTGSSSAAAAASSGEQLRKPVDVIYCPISGWPAEMCEYNGQFAQCKQWHIDHAEELEVDADEIEAGGEKGRKQKLPTDDLTLGNPNKKNQVKELTIDLRKRTGRKKLTMIKGLEFWGIQPNPVAQALKKKFSCGTAVIDPPSSGMPATVEVQGDNTTALIAMLTGKDYNIPEDAIVLLREGKPLRKKPGDGNQQDESSSDEDDESKKQQLPPPQKSNPANNDDEDVAALLVNNNKETAAPRPKGKGKRPPGGKKK